MPPGVRGTPATEDTGGRRPKRPVWSDIRSMEVGLASIDRV